MANQYEQNLDRQPANHQPLTPISFLERAARTYPDHVAVIHGDRQMTYRDFWSRSRRLASALARHGIGKGDTVTVMLSNTPAMLEAHYGVPMVKAVLHSLNTRLDAAIIAFQLDHAGAKIVIVDREFSGVMEEALALAKVRPLVIDYDDPDYPADAPYPKGERIGTLDYEAFLAGGDPRFRLVDAGRRVGRDLAELHLGHDRQSEGRRLPPPRRGADGLRQHHPCRTWASTPSICGRCRCSTATAGAFPGRSPCRPAPMSACAGCAPRQMYDAIADHGVTHLCGAPIVMSTLINAADGDKRDFPADRAPSTPPPPRRPRPCWRAWPMPASR